MLFYDDVFLNQLNEDNIVLIYTIEIVDEYSLVVKYYKR